MNVERIGSLFWFTFGAGTIHGALGLGLGTPQEPGSGFLAFTAAVFVCLMAAGIFAATFRGGQANYRKLGDLWHGLNWGRSLAIIFFTVGFVLVFEHLGFFLTSFVLLVAIMRFLEDLSWKLAVLTPLGILAASYALFKVFLGISLPAGILGF